jgi:hypothetical protein
VTKAEKAGKDELRRVEPTHAPPRDGTIGVVDDAAGFELARAAVPPERIDDALRLLHLDVLQRGVAADELGRWLWAMHWFPHLNHHASILALAEGLPDSWRIGTLCDPQILLQFPHVGPEPEITLHRDVEPDWAQGRRYGRIVGVPLSPWRRENGGLLVQRGEEVEAVEADPGDAIAMDPELLHSGGVNRTGSIRYAVYFRWLLN